MQPQAIKLLLFSFHGNRRLKLNALDYIGNRYPVRGRQICCGFEYPLGSGQRPRDCDVRVGKREVH